MCPHLMLIKFLPLADPVGFSSISNRMTAKTALTKPYATQTLGLSHVLYTESSHVFCIIALWPVGSWTSSTSFVAILLQKKYMKPTAKTLVQSSAPPPKNLLTNTEKRSLAELSALIPFQIFIFMSFCGHSVWLTVRLSITVLSFRLSGTRMFFLLLLPPFCCIS